MGWKDHYSQALAHNIQEAGIAWKLKVCLNIVKGGRPYRFWLAYYSIKGYAAMFVEYACAVDW